jgi:7-cyano-7-deazaguanine synthase
VGFGSKSAVAFADIPPSNAVPRRFAADCAGASGFYWRHANVARAATQEMTLNRSIRSATRKPLPAPIPLKPEPDMSVEKHLAAEIWRANEKALVLFSGGQDSSTCLAWALERFAGVETIAFDYGQRHRIELECGHEVRASLARDYAQWAPRLGAGHLIDLGVLGAISDTALTREAAFEMGENGLPTTFVPGRNIFFLTVAAALAYRRGIRHIVGGMCETDYSGYPDCRDDTMKALQVALNLGMEKRFVLHTPLMWIDKAATWQLARELGGDDFVRLIVERTHSCYLGERACRHDWGYGCGACPACGLRAAGYRKFMELAKGA